MYGEKKVRIVCDQAGAVKVDAEGFVGNSCEEATRAFEMIYAGKQGPRQHKPEYYQENTGSAKQSVGRF